MGENSIRRPVVVGVDGSECSLQAVRWRLRKRRGGSCRCAWSRPTLGRREA
jgi:hypothetical protein